MFFVFCRKCFAAKKKKKSIIHAEKSREREKIGSLFYAVEREGKNLRAPKFLDRSSEEARNAHTRARTHRNHLKIERTTRNTKHHGRTRRRGIRKRTGGTSLLFSSFPLLSILKRKHATDIVEQTRRL